METEPGYYLVDGTWRIHDGEAAREALALQNDAAYFVPGKGVVQVPVARWRQAQEAEKHLWVDLARGADDDRNREHAARFDGYEAIRGERFPRAIELGCGPFTNLRIIADVCDVRSCDLLDPNLDSYRRLRHCRYRGRYLLGETSRLPRLWERVLRRLPGGDAVRRLAHPGSVRIDRRIVGPIEVMPQDRVYDLAIMVNVIEHCYDAPSILRMISAIVRPGGVLVFHEKAFAAAVVATRIERAWDIGHPLLVDASIYRDFFAAHFNIVFENSFPVSTVLGGCDLSYESGYVIARRR